MIRAFFNIRLDETYLPERTGQLVADHEEARAVARTIIRRLVEQHGGDPRLLNAVMAVTDAAGASLFDLSFFEALYVPVAAPAEPRRTPRRTAAVRPPRRIAPVAVEWTAGLAALASWAAARLAPLAQHRPRLALPEVVRGYRAAVLDLLSLRRDPRPRYGLGFEPGR